jgi:glucose-1-phosphate thymidylyltransferase
MVYIAGKPVIGHILDRMADLNPDEIILVVGYRKEQIISYVNENYADTFRITFVEQKQPLGLGHSVYMAKNAAGTSPIMITLGDMIFKAGYLDFYQKHADNGSCAGSIGVREVETPEKYGIVELGGEGISGLVEKPVNPASNLGIAGVYFINEPAKLFGVLGKMVDEHTDGEVQLTDALQEMVTCGHRLKHFYVSSWYDCGHSASLLETNRVLLDDSYGKRTLTITENEKRFKDGNSVIIEPVSIDDDVVIKNSVIGPHVSVANGCLIDRSIVSDSIIGSGTSISNVNLRSSIVGDNASVKGKTNSLNVGDSSSIEF